MPQAVVDPDELRQFARALKKFNTDLQDKTSYLGNQLNVLGSTWRDQEHKKFVEQFEQHLKMIARFTDATNQYIPYLVRKASHIEDYLQS
ncbi:MAG: hypothetical protein ACI9G1_002892 [Pirellulaceae bacterium]|jgi:uncharacterized protein YukE